MKSVIVFLICCVILYVGIYSYRMMFTDEINGLSLFAFIILGGITIGGPAYSWWNDTIKNILK